MDFSFKKILNDLNLKYLYYNEPERNVNKSKNRFCDILENIYEIKFSNFEMYCHQEEAIKCLIQGKNLIINAQTGSGKTEIWTFYTISNQLKNKNFKTLVVYPTKVLALDQLNRIKEYYLQAGFTLKEESYKSNSNFKKSKDIIVLKGDLLRYDGDVSRYIYDYEIQQALTLLTNPEILLDVLVSASHKLKKFFYNLKLVVLDEFDFYGSTNSTKLLFLIKKIKDIFRVDFQIILISATISNPFLIKEIIANTEIISGQAYKPQNNTYIILSKIEVYNKLNQELDNKNNKNEIIEKIIENNDEQINLEAFIDKIILHDLAHEILKENKILIIDILINIINQIREIKNKGRIFKVIVFVPSINIANILYKRLEEEINNNWKDIKLSDFIAIHHSKIKKEERMEIEQKFKNGDLSIVITVKTMSVGIDIGQVDKVIHYGLPLNIKEFIQKEGRKGRRKTQELQSTETMIIPFYKKDLLISKDYQTWKKLPPEKIIINFENKILNIYEKYINKLLYNELQFYDLSQKSFPYIVYHMDDHHCEIKNNISIKEFIDYYQPMSLNYSNDGVGIVISIYNKSIKKTEILELFILTEKLKDFSNFEQIIKSLPFELTQKYSIYFKIFYEIDRACKKIYNAWNENADIIKILTLGKVFSIVNETILTEKLPTKNSSFFDRVKLIPMNVFYIFESLNKYKIIKYNLVFRVYLYRSYKIDLFYRHSYTFWTYSIVNEFNFLEINLTNIGLEDIEFINFENQDFSLSFINVSIAIFKALLRCYYGIDLDLFKFSIEQEFNLLKIWENEPTGIIEKIILNQPLNLDNDVSITFENILKLIDDLDFYDYSFKLFLEVLGFKSFADTSFKLSNSLLDDKLEPNQKQKIVNHLNQFKKFLKIILSFLFYKTDYLLRKNSLLNIDDIKEILNEIEAKFKGKILQNKKVLFIDYYKLMETDYIFVFSQEDLNSDNYIYFSNSINYEKLGNIINLDNYDYIAFYYLPEQIINYLLAFKIKLINLNRFFYSVFFEIPLPLSYIQQLLFDDNSLLEKLNYLSFSYYSDNFNNFKKISEILDRNILDIFNIRKDLLVKSFNFYYLFYLEDNFFKGKLN